MKRIIYSILTVIVLGTMMYSCKKDGYFVGGDLHNPKINMTTYDWLKSNKDGVFDTVIMLIDKAGIKDKINKQGITFFAPTDYDVYNYVQVRTAQIQRIDPDKKWTVDSMIKYELPRFADSIDMYVVNQQLTNDMFNEKGTTYKNAKGNNVVVSYEETSDPNLGYNSASSIKPRIVYFSYLFQALGSNVPASGITLPVGVRTRVQTSNAQTTTGVVHVLNNSHTLFFYR
ncbi:MAG: fasciclin domain-containing protein [Sphingobacterium paramultivorum]